MEVGYSIKTDCIFHVNKIKGEGCTALKELYCSKEKCGFYKSRREYNADGTKKGNNYGKKI